MHILRYRKKRRGKTSHTYKEFQEYLEVCWCNYLPLATYCIFNTATLPVQGFFDFVECGQVLFLPRIVIRRYTLVRQLLRALVPISVLWLACVVVNLFRVSLRLARTSRIERERENICGIGSLLVSHPQKVRLVDDRRGLGVRQHIYFTSTLWCC